MSCNADDDDDDDDGGVSVTTVLTQYETLPIHCKMLDTRVCVWLAQSHQQMWKGHRTH